MGITRVLLLLPVGLLAVACSGEPDTATDPAKPTDPTSLVAADLERHLDCGHGFAVADDDGTRLLRIHLGDHGAPVPREVELPADRWTAVVEVGEHLANNWCSDLITEPEPTVEETWQVVAGTLTFSGDLPPTGPGRPTAVDAEATGLAVETADGERIELDDLTLHNAAWGFLAG